jgi:putative acetyltransferase
MKITIRPERKEDFSVIRQINRKAFHTDAEANLIEALRKSKVPIISLVAEYNDIVIGHILFSEVSLDGHCPDILISGLAPMAVLPEYQRKGIGSQLVNEGINICLDAGYPAIVVLGHPLFYPRFGFEPSVNFKIKSEFDVPDEVFMIKELTKDALTNCSGTIIYHAAFKQF